MSSGSRGRGVMAKHLHENHCFWVTPTFIQVLELFTYRRVSTPRRTI